MKIDKDFKAVLLKALQAGEIDTEDFPENKDFEANLKVLTDDELNEMCELLNKKRDTSI